MKYNIKLLSMSTLNVLGISERQLAKHVGIPWSTYQKDKHAKVGDKFSMPESRLLKYALAYGVKMEDLLNYRIEVKSIRKLYQSDNERIAGEFGLSQP